MRYRFFAIPALEPDQRALELNKLLSTARVLSVQRELVHDGQESFWAVCVSIAPPGGAQQPKVPGQGPRVDYKELLSPEHFAVFAKLRALRKQLAQEQGVPPYAVFNNAQLAAMVQQDVGTLAQLAKIPGVGPSRVTKYGQLFIAALREQEGPCPDAPA